MLWGRVLWPSPGRSRCCASRIRAPLERAEASCGVPDLLASPDDNRVARSIGMMFRRGRNTVDPKFCLCCVPDRQGTKASSIGLTGSFLDKGLLQRILAWVGPQSDVAAFRCGCVSRFSVVLGPPIRVIQPTAGVDGGRGGPTFSVLRCIWYTTCDRT